MLRSRAERICRVVGAKACDDEQQCGRCRPCRLFGFPKDERRQRGKIAVEDAEITDHHTCLRPHVAIDRFTGGALDSALYHDEVLDAGRFHLRIGDLAEIDPTVRLLLDAVINDLHHGYIGIGSRTTAGCGTVRVTSDWQPSNLDSFARSLCETES